MKFVLTNCYIIVYLPARTAVPTQESTPERKELNGKDPTIAM